MAYLAYFCINEKVARINWTELSRRISLKVELHNVEKTHWLSKEKIRLQIGIKGVINIYVDGLNTSQPPAEMQNVSWL